MEREDFDRDDRSRGSVHATLRPKHLGFAVASSEFDISLWLVNPDTRSAVNTALWDRYVEIRTEGLRNEDGGKAATEFYRDHFEEMNIGAEIAWEQRFNHDEFSALQHAINLKLQDEASFWAE